MRKLPPKSTPRVQKLRRKRKIEEIRKKSRWLLWAVQDFYTHEELDIKTWVLASDIYHAKLTDERIQMMPVFFHDPNDFFNSLNDVGIERATLRQGNEDVLLVRPRFLGEDVL